MAPELIVKGASAGARLEVFASGSWTSAHAAELEQKIDAIKLDAPGSGRLDIDIAGVGELDTFGAWLLERLARAFIAQGYDAQLAEVSGRFRGLLDEIHACGRTKPAIVKQNPILAKLEGIGVAATEFGQDLIRLIDLLGRLCSVIALVFRHPSRFRFASAVHQLDRVGWQALPIIFLITLLIGAIIAQQGIFHFRKFGAGDYVVDLVGILVLRELGVLIVAIMVAGRSGSSYTAELGSMKMREEIDALRTMGLDPVEVLMLPRIVALVCALPILTFFGSMCALYGGGLVAWLYGGMSPPIYIARLKEAVSVTHFEVGMIKAPFMALVIGLVACSEGLQVAGSAESLGLKTTASVVKSIFLVIVMDGFFAIFFASVGM
ncbi:MlaE family lipid ABC transporter permease subunit [Methylocapsa polymorpha]|uniref:MlaE family lipid ABC transporter permease subunit n=1 Tax=Methylocapsa polymorpha TaxID=3080828 RepID=A0ABZ0HV14_9HYPH|nr:MlaE family lipid ABC transporter permease subunit [Methylocapsa sp. RX1]